MHVRSVKVPRLPLFQLSGRQEVLAGSENAHRVLGILIGQGVLRPDPGPCFLDLDQVDVITSSFLRDCLLEYRNHARTTVPHLYPVIANPAPKVLYEMTGYLQDHGDAIWICRLDRHGSVKDPEVIGALDPIQQQTLELVRRLGTADAPRLAAKDRSVGPTAWNNRLAALASRRLLIERRAGKTKIFSPVLEVR